MTNSGHKDCIEAFATEIAFDQLGFNMNLLQSTIINQTISEFHSNIDLSAPLRITVKVRQL